MTFRDRALRACGACVAALAAIACAPAAEESTRASDASAEIVRASNPSHATVPAAPVVADRVSPPIDLGAVINQAHFAFRERAGVSMGGHSTYSVRVSPTGRVTFAPRRPGGEQHRASDPRMTGLAPTAKASTARRAPAVEGTPWALETTSLRRGSADLGEGESRTTIAGDGHVDVTRGAAVERLRNGPDGLEQSWSFDREPAGRGDLVVHIAATGLVWKGSTSGGLHFVDAHSGLGVRYGRATWIDSRGARTSLETRWTDGSITIDVPEAVLRASDYPAAIDPTVSPEIAVDSPVTTVAGGAQAWPVVASDGSGFLAVWEDSRKDADIWGARVAADGTPLDPLGFPISATAASEQAPDVSFDGSDYLVVWQDSRSTSTGLDIYGARVTAGGAVLDGSGIAVCTAPGDQTAPAVAHAGSTGLVVWQDLRSQLDGGSTGYDVYGARVAAGAALDGGGIAISNTVNDQLVPDVASDGSGYLVAWQDAFALGADASTSADIHAARVSGAGALLDAAGIVVSTTMGDQIGPAVAWGNGEYLVAWEDAKDDSAAADVVTTRVTPAGVVLDATGIVVAAGSGRQGAPAVAAGSSTFVITWEDVPITDGGVAKSSVFAGRLAPSGAVLDAGGVRVSASGVSASTPTIGRSAGGYLVAWAEASASLSLFSSGTSIRGARLGDSATVVDTTSLELTKSRNIELFPQAAFDGTNSLIVWTDNRDAASSDVYGVRVSPAGTLLDATAIPIATGAGDALFPSVTYDGTNYLVVWSDYLIDPDGGGLSVASTAAVRLTRAGLILDSTPLPLGALSATLGRASIASNGSGSLGAWVAPLPGIDAGSAGELRVTRIAQSGAALDPGGVLVAAPVPFEPFYSWLTVASDGTDYLVVWPDVIVDEAGATQSVRILGARIASDGTVRDPGGFAVSPSTYLAVLPTAAFDGSNYLVTWMRADPTSSQWEIHGARVSTAGGVLDPAGLVLSSGTASRAYPAVVTLGDGTGWLLAWDDQRNGFDDLYGATVRSDGTVPDPDGFPIAPSTVTNGLAFPSFVAAGPGRGLLAYSRYDATVDAARVFVRFVTSAVLGAACASGDACATGSCTDGLCCDESCVGACRGCALTPGHCAPVLGSDDPDTCTGSRTCDAFGACRSKNGEPCSAAVECASTNCADGYCCDTECSGGCDVCSATPGTCTVVAAGNPGADPGCAPYVCAGGATCPTSCATDATCASSAAYCASGGFCAPRRGQAEPCDPAADCTTPTCRICDTGSCSDGYCCDVPCDASCDVCDVVPGTCTLAPSGAVGAPSCAPFACTGASSLCPGTCVTAVDCGADAWCDAGSCRARSAEGVACTTKDECLGSVCADGVCCTAPCTGQCEACDVPGSTGTCIPVSGAPRAGRSACDPGTPADPCAATACNGVDRDLCGGFAGADVSCRAPSCQADVATPAASCDGSGVCPPALTRPCDPYRCTGNACGTTCASDADCATGSRCDRSACVSGATCENGDTLVQLDGTRRSCVPYRCTAEGTCHASCTSQGDCASDHRCNAAGACVSLDSTAESTGACAVGSSAPSVPFGAGALMVGSLLFARRRRRLDHAYEGGRHAPRGALPRVHS